MHARGGGRTRGSFQEGVEKKKCRWGSCPVDFRCSKLPSLLRLSFKGGFFERYEEPGGKAVGWRERRQRDGEKGKSEARHTSQQKRTGHFVAWNMEEEGGGKRSLRNKGLKRHMFFLVKLAPPLREIA